MSHACLELIACVRRARDRADRLESQGLSEIAERHRAEADACVRSLTELRRKESGPSATQPE